MIGSPRHPNLACVDRLNIFVMCDDQDLTPNDFTVCSFFLCVRCLYASIPLRKNPAKDEKKALVLANRNTGGRGKKRELQTIQSVSFSR